MICTLAWRHEVVRSLTKPITIAAVAATLVGNILAFHALHNDQVVDLSANQGIAGLSLLFPIQLVITFGLCLHLLIGASSRRARNWEQSLPISTATLWSGYVLALVFAGLLLTSVVTAALALLSFAVSLLVDDSIIKISDVFGLIARPVVVMLIGSVLTATYRRKEVNPGLNRTWFRFQILLSSSLVLLLLVLLVIPLYFSILPVLGTLILAFISYRKLPVNFDRSIDRNLVEIQSERTNSRASEIDIKPQRWLVHLAICRLLFKWPANWLLLVPMAGLCGICLNGYLPFSDTIEYTQSSYFFLCVYILLAPAGGFMEKLHLVDSWAVSRQTILLWLIVPTAVALIAGYGIGNLLKPAVISSTEDFVFENQLDNYGFKIPPILFEIGSTTDPIEIVAPWGETFTREQEPVYKGLPFKVSKPYTTPKQASLDFVAWQVSRAVTRAYAVDIPAAEIAQRYFYVQADGLVQVNEGGLTLKQDYSELQMVGQGPVFPILVGGMLFCYLLANFFHFTNFRPGVTKKRGRISFWATMALLLALHMGGFICFIVGFTDDWIINAVVMGTILRIGEAGSAGILLTWAAIIGLVAIMYRTTLLAFYRAEAPHS